MTESNYTDTDRAERHVREARRLLSIIATDMRECADENILDAIEALNDWMKEWTT